MQPLVYLATRTVVNGLKRALLSARRLISLVALVLYYLFVFVRPFDRSPRYPGSFQQFQAPAHSTIEAIVFGLFAVLSLLLMMGVLSYRGNFRPADIDVLFPTPVSPKLVLIFRIARDYVMTLLLPLLMAIFFFRPAAAGFASFFAHQPDTAKYVGRVSTVAWVLMAMFWVCAGYALSLWANRSELRAEWNRKVLGWAIAGLILCTIVFIILKIRAMESPSDMISLAQEPFLRGVFFTATIASQMVTGTLTGATGTTLAMGGLLLLMIGAAFAASFAQVQWMYDQAASRGTDAQTLRSLQRQGDMIGMMAEQARRGKLKAKRVTWLHRLRTHGVLAIIWKEAIILLRSSTVSFLVMVPIVFALIVMPVIGLSGSGSARMQQAIGPLFLFMNVMAVFMLSISLSQGGFIEMLRRVDLEKPLPFSAAQIVGGEVAAKVLPTTLVCWAASMTAVAIQPAVWQEGLAALIGIPFAGALVSGVVLLMTVLFPDLDDPTQRSFRGLMIMLGMVVTGGPCIGLYLVLKLLVASPLASLIASALAAGIFAGVVAIAGNLYAAYNPSE